MRIVDHCGWSAAEGGSAEHGHRREETEAGRRSGEMAGACFGLPELRRLSAGDSQPSGMHDQIYDDHRHGGCEGTLLPIESRLCT